MTAHCRPEKFPDHSDMLTAAEFVALAIDPAIPFTAAVDRIAERLAELRKFPPPDSPPGLADPPGSGGFPRPSTVTPGGTNQ